MFFVCVFVCSQHQRIYILIRQDKFILCILGYLKLENLKLENNYGLNNGFNKTWEITCIHLQKNCKFRVEN